MDHLIIITVKPESTREALTELSRVNRHHTITKWFDQEMALVTLGSDDRHVADQFKKNKPIYLQHICPVNARINIRNETADLGAIANEVMNIRHLLHPEQTFSVQTRYVNAKTKPYKKFELNDTVAQNVINATGMKLDVKNPEQIISILCLGTEAFIGISKAGDNISDWAGGKQRFMKDPDQISRAEFKLMEAIQYFNVQLPGGGTALDLGAAPGGWTRVLLNEGLHVHAVDPAILDRAILKHKNARHYTETAQAFLKRQNRTVYDVIANDMKMDVEQSVDIMQRAAPHLKAGGCALLTLKLKSGNTMKIVERCIKRLRASYRVLGARQLFHNRSEVTVYMTSAE